MTRSAPIVAATLLLALSGSAALASEVQFRLIERRGQTAWTGGTGNVLDDNIFNLAVQARVVGGAPGEALGNFGFDIISNDATANGTLNKASISNLDGTYNTAGTQFNNNASVGRGGLAAIYTYLAGISPNFNGLINVSGGSYSENPIINDIGLVTGSPTGSSLLLLTAPGGGDNPDTYPGTGTSAPLDPAIANAYLGANENWVDVYHFNYTRAFASVQPLTFDLVNVQAQTFSSLALANNVWGPSNPVNAAGIQATGIVFTLVPGPAAGSLLGAAALFITRRRRV